MSPALGESSSRERAYANAPNLDLLRAFAVLLVVSYHTAVFAGVGRAAVRALGRAGVYLFFVHTSFVLMLSLSRHLAAQRTHWVGAFYVRRLFRIYPLSIVAVLLVAIFAIPVKNITAPWTLGVEPAHVGTVVSNLALTMNLTGHNPMLGPLWSLPLEVQMYVFLPVAYLVAKRWGRVAVFVLWFAAVLVGLGSHYGHIGGSENLLRFIPNFLPGVLAFSLIDRSRPILPAWLWLPVLAVLVAAYCVMPAERTGWMMCLIVGVAIPFFHQAKAGVVTKIANLIARYSYGIYLGHLFCIWFAFVVVKTSLLAQCCIYGVMLIAVPVAVYHLLEEPLVKLGARVADRLGRAKLSPARS